MAIVHVIHEPVLGCQTIAFDSHAIRRMQERKVTEDEEIDTLKNPTHQGLPTDSDRMRFRKMFPAGGWIDVVFELDPTQVVVISVIRGK